MTQWQFALCQHPMYLIIEFDETAGERTPPWGEPDIDSYIRRIRLNLAALERYPQLKFNYDFSGVELERLAERAPGLIEQLRQYLAQGRVGFVNGSYAQAHVQGLEMESNLRQLTEGLAAIERILGVRVRTYAHQEPAIHDQMPQLLQALGYRFAVTPGFFWVLSFQTPHEILGVQYQGLRFMQDEEFTRWRGLDGAEVPLYLTQPRILPKGGVHGTESHKRALRNEWVKGLLHYPPIRCDFPDMVDIDDEWVEDHAGHEYVILDRALEARFVQTPLRSTARLYTYWGYGEGMEAEELHRVDRRAEAALLEAESLGALARALAGRPADDLREPWRKLLQAQHHDCYWVAGIGLRNCALGWVGEAQSAADAAQAGARQALTSQIDTRTPEGTHPLVLWEPWPLARADVCAVQVDLPAGTQGVAVQDERGESVPSQVLSVEQNGNAVRVRALVLAQTHGLGYRVLRAAPALADPTSPAGLTYENAFYRAQVEPDGTFSSLRTASGVELIASGPYRGNQFRAQTEKGEWLEFYGEGAPEVSCGPLLQRVVARGSIGGARLTQEILFYHDLPRIDFTLTWDFDNTLLGNFWQDESKLNLYWPVAPRGHIDHDIPFGVIQGRAERSFAPTRWLRVGDARTGLALFNRGVNRHWIRNNVTANVLACGITGRDIGTRAMPFPYIKDYDLRLRGRHVIHYAALPHDGGWREADLPRRAFSYRYPLRAEAALAHAGSLPSALSLLRLDAPGLIPTALYAEGEALVCRLFETRGETASWAALVRAPWRVRALRDLSGQPVGQVDPFRIVQAELGQ